MTLFDDPEDPDATDPNDSWTVGGLHKHINEVLRESMGSVWVTGEVRGLSPWNDWRFFDLVDPPPKSGRIRHDSKPDKLAVRLSPSDRQSINRQIEKVGSTLSLQDGATLRIRGRVRSFAQRSEIQLEMTEIDLFYTLGVMAQLRENTLATITAAGLLHANSQLDLADPPLRVALITSKGSAAEADVMDELRTSGHAFKVSALDARTQGQYAESTIVSALATADSLNLDAIVLVRGGGSALDLQPFDGEPIATAIATSNTPVLTGIGHETDSTVAGEVSHTDLKTPTACAAFLNQRASEMQQKLATYSTRLSDAARDSIASHTASVQRTTRHIAQATRSHATRESEVLSRQGSRLTAAARSTMDSTQRVLTVSAGSTAKLATDQLTRWTETLDQQSSLVAAHAPTHAFARGWSITRSADGTVLKSLESAAAGDVINTSILGGTITSRVEELDAVNPREDQDDIA